MRKMGLFAGRNIKELIRDPLSYIFCLGFPVVMLAVMSLVNESIPPEAGMDIFRIDKLSAGIGFFGLMFTMFFSALQVSKDRSGSFLVRLYASPMHAGDFIGGYFFSMLAVAAAQLLICAVCSYIISLITGAELSLSRLMLSVVVLIPSAALLIGFGMLFGSIFSDKAAPGLCSVLISLGSMLGGVFMDVDGLGGVILSISRVLPFYHCVKTARCVIAGDYADFVPSMLVLLAYCIVIGFTAVFAFGRKMKADLN